MLFNNVADPHHFDVNPHPAQGRENYALPTQALTPFP
jgi:hypothetical protein